VTEIPSPPRERADGRSCDAGGCNAESVGWRYFPFPGEWLPVCERDMQVKGVPRRFRIYDEEMS
jgi:hypothetical protein